MIWRLIRVNDPKELGFAERFRFASRSHQPNRRLPALPVTVRNSGEAKPC